MSNGGWRRVEPRTYVVQLEASRSEKVHAIRALWNFYRRSLPDRMDGLLARLVRPSDPTAVSRRAAVREERSL